MVKRDSIRVLICSGNLGNKEPDQQSLNAWIPDDGKHHEIIRNNAYPLPPHPSARNRKNFHSTACFQLDMIVVGMQEATFESQTQGEEKRKLTITKPIPKAVTKAAKKGRVAIQTLRTDKDHTKKRQRGDDNINDSNNIGSSMGSANNNNGGGGGINSTNHSDTSAGRDDGTAVLHRMLQNRLPSFTHVVSYQRGEMRLEIFVNDPAATVEVLSVRAQNTGIAGLANKGGIVAELLVNGSTRMSFLSAHLEAHEGAQKYQMRCSTMADILQGTATKQPPFGRYDASITSHFMFCLGDLNFRTELDPPREDDEQQEWSKEEHIARVRKLVDEEDWIALNKADELRKALNKKDCLAGFETLPCHFPPTFKVERQDGYIYKDNRRPSYTDRILWKAGHECKNRIRPIVYEPIDTFTTSDHKPIRGLFEVQLNESKKMRPTLPRRRMSMSLFEGSRNLLRPSHHHSNREDDQYKRLNLHLFITDVQCRIARTYSNPSAPDPYVAFVSQPEDAIKREVKNYWKLLKKVVGQGRHHRTTNKKEDGGIERSACGFPVTTKKKSTYQPDWGDEEVHFIVRTHYRDGSSLDLTGAIIKISVMDHSSKGEDRIIGTFSFNLANLIKMSKKNYQSQQQEPAPQSAKSLRSFRIRRNDSSKSTNPKQGHQVEYMSGPQEVETITTNGSTTNETATPEVNSYGVSLEDFLAKKSDDDDDDDKREELKRSNSHRSYDTFDSIFSEEIDEPFYKNGKEMGRITFTIDTWWLKEGQSRHAVIEKGTFAQRHSFRHGKPSSKVINGLKSGLHLSGAHGNNPSGRHAGRRPTPRRAFVLKKHENAHGDGNENSSVSLMSEPSVRLTRKSRSARVKRFLSKKPGQIRRAFTRRECSSLPT